LTLKLKLGHKWVKELPFSPRDASSVMWLLMSDTPSHRLLLFLSVRHRQSRWRTMAETWPALKLCSVNKKPSRRTCRHCSSRYRYRLWCGPSL